MTEKSALSDKLSVLTEFHAARCLLLESLRVISPPRNPLNIRESERKAVSRRDTMAQRRQRGWLKKESRIPGETWVLYFRTTRKSDGRRVENKIPSGSIRDLPDKRTAWAEVERLHLPINPVDSRRGGTLHIVFLELGSCRAFCFLTITCV
jgi:hypothetical protein